MEIRMKDIVVFDLDGVLRHGIELDENMHELLASIDVVSMVYLFSPCAEGLRGNEEQWLKDNEVEYVQLLMRPDIAAESFHDFKLRMLKDVIPADRVICVFEDNPITAEDMTHAGFTVCRVMRGV